MEIFLSLILGKNLLYLFNEKLQHFFFLSEVFFSILRSVTFILCLLFAVEICWDIKKKTNDKKLADSYAESIDSLWYALCSPALHG